MKSAETHLRVLVAGMLAGIVILAVGAVVRSDRVRATPEALLHPAKAAAHARLESLAARDETPSALQSLDPVARTVSLSEDDRIIARARKEVLAAQEKMARMSLFKDSSAKSQPAAKELIHRHRAHFGLVYPKAAAPKELQGRVTMLAKGPTHRPRQVLSGGSKQMMLAERDDRKLARSQAKAAGQIKNFAATLLSSQRKAAAELHDLEKHFGR